MFLRSWFPDRLGFDSPDMRLRWLDGELARLESIPPEQFDEPDEARAMLAELRDAFEAERSKYEQPKG